MREYGSPWSVEEFELDPPRAGEVLVQMAAAGLCRSDDHIRTGYITAPKPDPKRYRQPTIGGHEGSGIVLAVGPGVARLVPGDHVVTSFVPVCGGCRWCASGMEYLCDAGAGVMVPGMPTDGTFRHHSIDGEDLGHTAKIGAFAEHTVVAAESLLKIDEQLPLIPSALLACAVPTGYGAAVHDGQVRGGDTSVVIGAGGIGTAAIQGARINGATLIIAVDPVDARQKSALAFGATHTAASSAEAITLVRELTRGVMADSVVVSPSDVTGAELTAALALTRKGGHCVLVGMAAPGPQPVMLDLQDIVLMNKNLSGTVFGSCNPRSEIPMLATMYASGQLQLDEMVTRRYRLDEINEGFEDLDRGELVRGVIDFGIR